MDAGSENPRGVHAIKVLTDRKDFTMQGLIDAAFDSYLTAFDDPPDELAGEPMNYDGETAERRTARRRARWTPARIVEA